MDDLKVAISVDENKHVVSRTGLDLGKRRSDLHLLYDFDVLIDNMKSFEPRFLSDPELIRGYLLKHQREFCAWHIERVLFLEILVQVME